MFLCGILLLLDFEKKIAFRIMRFAFAFSHFRIFALCECDAFASHSHRDFAEPSHSHRIRIRFLRSRRIRIAFAFEDECEFTSLLVPFYLLYLFTFLYHSQYLPSHLLEIMFDKFSDSGSGPPKRRGGSIGVIGIVHKAENNSPDEFNIDLEARRIVKLTRGFPDPVVHGLHFIRFIKVILDDTHSHRTVSEEDSLGQRVTSL